MNDDEKEKQKVLKSMCKVRLWMKSLSIWISEPANMLIGGLGCFIASALLAACLPIILTKYSSPMSLTVTDANAIGDTIGGIMGPAVGLIGGLLAFLAFWAQYDANIRQRKEFRISLKQQRNEANSQSRATQIEQFESRYYLLLSLHRENAASIEINNRSGRKLFLNFFHELRFIYWAIHDFYKRRGKAATGGVLLKNNDIFQVAYLTFFFGYGPDSTPMVESIVGDRLRGFATNAHEYLATLVAHHKAKSAKGAPITVPTLEKHVQWKRLYPLGVGHITRLSHYIRHLYQTVKFVDDQDKELLTYDQKYNYISNLRAQLSTHEQLLLYYNARSIMGKPWLDFDPTKDEKEGLLARYCMIKSIPLNAADFFENPKKFFGIENKEGKKMFEWTEITDRMNSLPS